MKEGGGEGYRWGVQDRCFREQTWGVFVGGSQEPLQEQIRTPPWPHISAEESRARGRGGLGPGVETPPGYSWKEGWLTGWLTHWGQRSIMHEVSYLLGGWGAWRGWQVGPWGEQCRLGAEAGAWVAGTGRAHRGFGFNAVMQASTPRGLWTGRKQLLSIRLWAWPPGFGKTTRQTI